MINRRHHGSAASISGVQYPQHWHSPATLRGGGDDPSLSPAAAATAVRTATQSTGTATTDGSAAIFRQWDASTQLDAASYTG